MLQIKVRYAKSLKDKSLGLIGKSIEPIYFETHWGIHTFGVKEPIDIVILNKESAVVAIKSALKPNRIFLWNPRFYRVLELPEGKIREYKIKENEIINLHY